MNIWESEHYSNEEVIICFVESWFSEEYYEVFWKWAKPSSWREKIFGCGWHIIREYRDYSCFDYNDSSQWIEKTFTLDSSLPKIKQYVDKNIHTYQEMADYFGMTESEKRYSEAKRRYLEKKAKNQELRKKLYAN